MLSFLSPSLCVITLRFIHVVGCVTVHFLYSYIVLYFKDMGSLIHLLMNWGSVQSEVNMTKAPVTSHAFVWPYVFHFYCINTQE